MRCRIWVAGFALLRLVAIARGQATQPDAPKTGTFEVKFTDRSPMSAPDQLAKRLGLAKPEADYDLSSYEFIVHVPDNYDPAKPLGVMYLMLYKNTGEPPTPCLPLFDECGLIFVVPKSKDATEVVRCGQALDVIHNLKQQYKIDDQRLYLFAMARSWEKPFDHSNTHLALCCCDVFTALHLQGVAFYRQMDRPDGRYWTQQVSPPPAAAFMQAKRRPVILDHDGDQEATKLLLRMFQSDGFKYVSLERSTGEDFHYPNVKPEVLRKFFNTFEEAAAKAKAAATQPEAKVATPPTSKPSAPKPAAPAAPAVSEAARILKIAESYISAKSYIQARTRLNAIIEKFPTSPEAIKAKELLKQIEGK